MSDPAHIWVVRAGYGGHNADDWREQGIASIGFGTPEDLSGLSDREDFLEAFKRHNPLDKEQRAIASASQLYRFVRELAEGDLVLTPVRETREIHMGIVDGPYAYQPGLIEGQPHTRSMQWQRTVSRDLLSAPARNSAGSSLTLFSMNDHRAEVLAVYEHGAAVEDKSPETQIAEAEADFFEEVQSRADELIADRLAFMDPYDLQDLVAALLRAMGYHTQVSPPGADRGVDIIATPDPLGFETPRIRGQVKRRSSRTGGEEMRGFLATLRAGERGLFVSTGGFTKDAKYESERAPQGVAVTLLDGTQFVDVLTDYYDKLDQEAKALLPLKPVYLPVDAD